VSPPGARQATLISTPTTWPASYPSASRIDHPAPVLPADPVPIMLGPGVPRSARRRYVGRPPRPVSRAWPGPDRGRMAGLHPPRWTIRNRQRWPPRGPARRDGRQWAQRASRGGRGVRGGAGRVLTVSLLMAPAGGSGRRHACLARTPPPWATRCRGEARRAARLTRWAGAVGRAG